METEQHGDFERIQKANLKRARVTAVTFGVITGLALISFVYAFVQQDIAKENARVAIELQTKLNDCSKEAQRQSELARKMAEEIAKQMQLLKEENSKLKK
ncbi:MAG: hypothetical protein QM734_11650 [Cyclobacteriaceae bacterium]